MSGPSHDPLLNARQTGYTRRGFGAQYHAYRPRPPAALIDALVQLARVSRPGLVVDLGCGTGISTGIWAPRAECVIGIEPLDEMRKRSEEHTSELQSPCNLVCRLLLEKKKNK